MTYCVGLSVDRGLVFMSDTRTNAGVDNISVVQKMRTWEVPGERFLCLMSAGNLATTQATISLLEERVLDPANREPALLKQPSMFQTAKLIGDTLKEVIAETSPTGQSADARFAASFILGGQVKGFKPCLFMIYPEGNFIEAGLDNPFFQIGEHKYGRPIIVRTYDPRMSLEEVAKLLLVSFDSTIRSNLSVGLPIDMQFYETDSFKAGYRRRFDRTDPYYNLISEGWSEALKKAFDDLPPFVAA
ncbi:proteasome-type protease [Mangrovibrevibacter kandeliae]|uniref:proteasome-type protease n=1 Tax=Mangrovibrevibacter kandeliae TaxID=2968473 RepID=UPI00211976AC|nr:MULTISPECIES: proteasome-type protease [unclassified Aurantimonas]MCQ8781277.1 proteasome-type protease [Aurantimonas sp. CSK15Z-1]MCW4114059.1 proteasome-type protease [Aurantimonas sp. MSK8Z-1]